VQLWYLMLETFLEAVLYLFISRQNIPFARGKSSVYSLQQVGYVFVFVIISLLSREIQVKVGPPKQSELV
jgi:hypothetical protein